MYTFILNYTLHDWINNVSLYHCLSLIELRLIYNAVKALKTLDCRNELRSALRSFLVDTCALHNPGLTCNSSQFTGTARCRSGVINPVAIACVHVRVLALDAKLTLSSEPSLAACSNRAEKNKNKSFHASPGAIQTFPMHNAGGRVFLIKIMFSKCIVLVA